MQKNNQTKFKETEIGFIPEEWDIFNIADAVEIIDGDRGNNYPNGSDFIKEGYSLFLNAKNVCGSNFNFSECQFINKSKDEELRKGKTEYRADKDNIVHMAIGKVSFGSEKIHQNYEALINVLPTKKIESIYLTTSMGPSIKVSSK